MTTNLDNILEIANQKFGFEVVVQTEESNRLRIVGRIRSDNAGRNLGNWLLVIDRLLEADRTGKWSVDISKHYFKKGKGQPVVFGWRLIFQGEKIAQHYADIVNLISTAPQTARTEVTEMPMPGSSAHRNTTAGGRRGAGLTDHTAVGPLAAARKSAGG